MKPSLIPAQRRQRDGPRQSDHLPPAPPGPSNHASEGGRHTDRPHPPNPPAPDRPGRTGPPTRGHRTQNQARGGRNRAAPPRASKTAHGTGAGNAEGHKLQTAWNGPTGALHRNQGGACATPSRGGGKGAHAAGVRAHTHAKGTRGKPEGQPDRARGTHRPHGMAYQRARRRDTRMELPATHNPGKAERGRGARERRRNCHRPQPSDLPRAPRTHDQGTAPAKAVVAHGARHQPHGQAASAPAQGGPTGDKPVARAQRHRHPG